MSNRYIEIDFNNVEGYMKLTPKQRKLFKDTYKQHNTMIGADYKKGWTPVRVNWIKNYLKVEFQNGGWLHYTKEGKWY